MKREGKQQCGKEKEKRTQKIKSILKRNSFQVILEDQETRYIGQNIDELL